VSEPVCERCGARFGCGAGEGTCWCAGVGLDDAARAVLAERYERCLCPTCLAAAAAERPEQYAPGARA
jgi:Cysteine-rich CWC